MWNSSSRPLAPAQPPLLGLGLLLPAAAPDLGHGVAPLGHSCTVAAWHSRLLPLTSDVGNSSWPLLLGHGVLPASAPDLRGGVAPLSHAMCTVAATGTLESEKVGLKLNIQKMKIMAYGPITSWQIDGETVEIVSDFIFGGSKITADGDCSHEIKRCLLLRRKVMTNLDSILKSRYIALPTKVRLVKVMVFPVVIYGCESWTVKKAEHQRIDAFELWCWRRLLRVP